LVRQARESAGDFDLDLQAEAGQAFRAAMRFQLGDALDIGGRESGNANFLSAP